MAYTTNEIIEPFWSEYSSEASGRDPLAIQNSSVVIYAKMIVGITNVTNRIRYTGFYCWLLDTIAHKITKKNSLVEQIRYIRRAELLIANMMVHEFQLVTGISGTNFAARNKEPLINLIAGADWDTKISSQSLYWKFKFGVFGQYYSGVVRDLNLINHPDEQVDLKIYTLTAKGKDLAKAFGNNISENEKALFWKSIYSGIIPETDLSKLKSFALHIIPPNTDESQLYETIMLSNDDRNLEPTFNRRDTIRMLLQLLKDKNEGVENLPTEFLRNNYLKHITQNQLKNDTATSWYLFEINELLHVALEHFHACFLYVVQPFPTLLSECIKTLIDGTQKAFKSVDTDTSIKINELSEILLKEDKNVYDYYVAMEKAFKIDDWGVCLMNSINTILCVYNNCKDQISRLNEIAIKPENNFKRPGNAIELIDELVETKLQLSIIDYTKTVLLHAINLHTFSSYQKSKIGQSLVHNYMIEGNQVWRLRQTLPNRTSPRLQNAVQYMTDLSWIKKDGKTMSITDLGIQVIR